MKYNQIRKAPPKKNASKYSFCGKKVGKLLNIAGLSPGVSFLLNLRFSSDLFPFNILVKNK
jgi:hypothetical protein